MMKHFGFSIIFTIVCLAISAYWGYTHGPEAGLKTMFTALTITAILAVMEVSLSFDNAVVNASVLRGWDHFWKMIFLTVGIVIAVAGALLVYGTMKKVVGLRLSQEDEHEGADLAIHKISAVMDDLQS